MQSGAGAFGRGETDNKGKGGSEGNRIRRCTGSGAETTEGECRKNRWFGRRDNRIFLFTLIGMARETQQINPVSEIRMKFQLDRSKTLLRVYSS